MLYIAQHNLARDNNRTKKRQHIQYQQTHTKDKHKNWQEKWIKKRQQGRADKPWHGTHAAFVDGAIFDAKAEGGLGGPWVQEAGDIVGAQPHAHARSDERPDDGARLWKKIIEISDAT